MSKSPQELLKKLKPTRSFDVTHDCIAELARLAIDHGVEAFVGEWRQVALPTKRTSSKTNPSSDPAVVAAIAILTEFSKSKQLTSAQVAKAFLSFLIDKHSSLPKPTKTAEKGIAAAVRWAVGKTNPGVVSEACSQFVERFAA